MLTYFLYASPLISQNSIITYENNSPAVIAKEVAITYGFDEKVIETIIAIFKKEAKSPQSYKKELKNQTLYFAGVTPVNFLNAL